MTNKVKRALITGLTGQSGSYLAELLLSKGYKVIGLKRRSSIINTERIDHLYGNPNFEAIFYDFDDPGSIWRILNEYKPDEIYNLGAQSHVKVSFELPEHTVNTIVQGTLRILEAMRSICPEARFYQASSSEMFGDNPILPLNENSKLSPASPYACAKVFAHHLVNNYRKAYGLHLSSGVLFNHESPRRGETFVTRKITLAAARIKLGLQDNLELGNLDAKRDWGHAKDYVMAMYLMLQQDKPDDYVIATGETHTVREFLQEVFLYAGLGHYEDYVKINPEYFRPQEVPALLGDPRKAAGKLRWQPTVKFKELARQMYDADFLRIKEEINKGVIKWETIKK